ncbi:MAG: hypothetical protein WEC84_01295 [Candidatus Andersenbacteria bacterium]
MSAGALHAASVIVFSGFFLASFYVIAVNQAWARTLFIWGFVGVLTVAGVTGYAFWPLFDWHLYPHTAESSFVFYEIRLSDKQGHEIPYDAWAASPTLTTPVRRYAARLIAYNDTRAEELARFFLVQANMYREHIQGGGQSKYAWYVFPPHQYGYSWDAEELSGIQTFSELHVFKREVQMSEDGKHILVDRENLVRTFSL